MARLLYEQLEAGNLNPAQIISTFSDEEEQRVVAGLFHARLPQLESENDQNKALEDVLNRISQDSLQSKKDQVDVTDLADLQRFVDAAKAQKK